MSAQRSILLDEFGEVERSVGPFVTMRGGTGVASRIETADDSVEIGEPATHRPLPSHMPVGRREKWDHPLARGSDLPEAKRIFDLDEPKSLEFEKSQSDSPPGGWPEGW
jgi:hypothetical protein